MRFLSNALSVSALLLFSLANAQAQLVTDGGSATINGPTNISGELTIGTNGSFTTLTITSAGTVTNTASGFIGRNSSASSNQVTVTGLGSAWNSDGVYVGHFGSGNQLVITNRGLVVANNGFTIGAQAGSSSNSMIVTGTNSLGITPQGLSFNAAFNTLIITNGGNLFVSVNTLIGNVFSGSNNLVVVTDRGSMLDTSTFSLGALGSFNQIVVANGGKVLSQGAYIGGNIFQTGSGNSNSVLITGSGSSWTNSNSFTLGNSGSGNQLTVTNGAVVRNTTSFAHLLMATQPTSSSNIATITGTNSLFSNLGLGSVFIGQSGSFNQLVVRNGAVIETDAGSVGFNNGATNNFALVTDPGSRWTNALDLSIGAEGSFNQLVVSNSATVAANNLLLGSLPGASNNTVTLTGGNIIVTNSTATSSVDVRRGTLTLNSGLLLTDQLSLTNGAQSQIAFNGGTLQTRNTTNNNGSTFVVGNGTSSASLEMLGTGFHRFFNGLRIPGNGLLKGNGTIIGNVTNASGGIFSPGASIGKLAIAGNLILASGSTNAFELNKTSGTNDNIIGITNVTYGGTLLLTNLAGTLANGDSFKLFTATTYSGTFSAVTPSTPGAGLEWNTSELVTNGTLRVGLAPAITATNVNLRVMAANISSGNNQRYETPGLNIFKGLKPDIVAIQEFNVSNSFGINTSDSLSNMVATTFGTNFVYFRETGFSIPNGIISRYPIVAAASWDDVQVADRSFAWAQIDLPGTNDLYVVSVHLHSTGGSSSRAIEANELKSLISTNFPTNAWVILAGDFNTDSRSETAVTTFKTFLSDSPIPNDGDTPTDPDTNAGRDKPYDYVLPSFSLTNSLTNVVIAARTFTNGLVFDSAVYTPLPDVSPVDSGDSHVFQMQHMAVVKDFRIVYTVTNATAAPSISTQPQTQSVTLGSNATFTVTADGTAPLSYQWRFTGTNIGGATLTSYTRTNAQNADAGSYTVVVTNTYGSVTSAVAVLTVNSSPAITTQPQSQTITVGQGATFTVTASGSTPLSYQWRFTGTNIGGATLSSYTRSNAQTNDAGSYTVVITNSFGSITSSVAVLTVNEAVTGTQTTLAGWDVNGLSAFGASPLSPTTNAAHLSVVGLTRGAGVTTTPTAALRGWGGNGFDSSTAAAAITANDFATFSISANAGYKVSFSSISKFDYRRSSTGPPNGVLQYQVGAGAFTDITTLAYTSSASGGASLGSNDLSTISALQNVAADTVVTFRIVNYGATAAGGTWYIFDVGNSTALDFTVLGIINSISSTNPPPGPATLSSPFLATNKFQFTVTGDAGSNYVVQVSTDLTAGNWLSLRTNVSPFTFVETNANSFTQRFFRAWSLP